MEVGIIPYGMDLLDDGSLGPRSIGRLKQARQVFFEFRTAEIVVSATFDPTRPEQAVSMAQLMADWLILHGLPATAIRVGKAKSFNTEGEQDVGISCHYGYEIHVSSWWHIPRIALMRWKRRKVFWTRVSYRAQWDVPPLKACLLEVGKFFAVLLFSKSVQKKLARFMKKRVRTSY